MRPFAGPTHSIDAAFGHPVQLVGATINRPTLWLGAAIGCPHYSVLMRATCCQFPGRPQNTHGLSFSQPIIWHWISYLSRVDLIHLFSIHIFLC